LRGKGSIYGHDYQKAGCRVSGEYAQALYVPLSGGALVRKWLAGAEAFEPPDPANALGNGFCGHRDDLSTTACMRRYADLLQRQVLMPHTFQVLLERSGEDEHEGSDPQRGVFLAPEKEC
jgi:hypothetical protein